MRRNKLWLAAAASLLLLPACGGSASSFAPWNAQRSMTGAQPRSSSAEAMVASYDAPQTLDEDGVVYAGAEEDYDLLGDPNAGRYELAREGREGWTAPERYAQATVPTTEGATVSSEPPPPPEPVADDAHHGPLLIYTADLRLAVHQVSEKQGMIEALATAAGGHLDHRTQNRIRIRVPAERFDEVLAQILELGDVLSRDVSVQDVSEQFHDMTLRIRTLEAMYTRVQQLLARAENVEQALAVEQHLQRITVELEQLRGRLRFLADRIAFSTITVQFQEQATVTEPTFSLPFEWLRSLGLEDLMRLR